MVSLRQCYEWFQELNIINEISWVDTLNPLSWG